MNFFGGSGNCRSSKQRRCEAGIVFLIQASLIGQQRTASRCTKSTALNRIPFISSGCHALGVCPALTREKARSTRSGVVFPKKSAEIIDKTYIKHTAILRVNTKDEQEKVCNNTMMRSVVHKTALAFFNRCSMFQSHKD